MRYVLEGNWRKGYAFDLHTLASTYLGPDEFGHDQFESTRSDMGELVYQFKYRNDRSALPKIIALITPIKGLEKFDALIPVPPSRSARSFQPVTELTKALGKDRGVAVITDALTKREDGPELKGVDAPDERLKLLRDKITLNPKADLKGKKLLLIDDLYRSGATLTVCTDILYNDAGADDVCVFTMTKTRSKR